MLVGILSDSHGHLKPVKQALQLFDEIAVDHIIHCGDVGGVNIFDQFVGRPFTFVWGNTDHPSPALMTYLRSVDIPLPDTIPIVNELDARRLAVFHGHESNLALFPQDANVHYVLHGHTHQVRDERRGHVRFINPGALHRVWRKTVAVLNLVTTELTFHEID